MIPGSSSCQKILRSPKVKMQRAFPERVRALKAKGSEMASTEVTGANWCGPHRTCSAQQTPLLFSYLINSSLPPDLARTTRGCPAPSVTMTLVEVSSVHYELVSKISFFFYEKTNFTMASINVSCRAEKFRVDIYTC